MWGRKKKKKKQRNPSAHQPFLPVFIIVPVCSGVSLCLLHPFIQTKERERTGDEEEEEEAEGLFSSQKKKTKTKGGGEKHK